MAKGLVQNIRDILRENISIQEAAKVVNKELKNTNTTTITIERYDLKKQEANVVACIVQTNHNIDTVDLSIVSRMFLVEEIINSIQQNPNITSVHVGRIMQCLLYFEKRINNDSLVQANKQLLENLLEFLYKNFNNSEIPIIKTKDFVAFKWFQKYSNCSALKANLTKCGVKDIAEFYTKINTFILNHWLELKGICKHLPEDNLWHAIPVELKFCILGPDSLLEVNHTTAIMGEMVEYNSITFLQL